MRTRWEAGGLMLLPAISLAACGDTPTEPDLTPPAIAAVAVRDDVAPLLAEMTVDLEGAAAVQVEYWAPSAPRLRVTSDAPAARHELLLARLVPDAIYEFEARAIGPDGDLGPAQSGSFASDTLPDSLEVVDFVTIGVPSVPLVRVELRGPPFNGFVVVDGAGRVVWYWATESSPQGSTRRANGDFVFLDLGRGLVEVTPGQDVAAELPTDPGRAVGERRMHHDVIATPDDKILFLANDSRDIGGTLYVGDAIWEWDPEGDLTTLRWTAWDHFSVAVDSGPRTRPGDWLHANALSVGPRGNILLSLHFLDQIVSLTSDLQSIEWRLGGPGSSFTLAADAVFSGQHTPVEVEPNRVLMFDNGFSRADSSEYSRALELQIDPDAGTVSKAWEFRPRPDNYARVISAARRLDNGNTFVAFGTSQGIAGTATGPIEVYEVTPVGRVIWYMRVDGPPSMYRATPMAPLAGETAVPEVSAPQ